MILLLLLILEAYALAGLVRLFLGPVNAALRWKILCTGLVAPILMAVVTMGVPMLLESIWPNVAIALAVVGCAMAASLTRWCGIGHKTAWQITGSFLLMQMAVTVLLIGIFAAA